MAKVSIETKILRNILEEIKLVRTEISLFLPNENLKEYTNSKKIMASYKKALKEYPPAPAWK